MSDLATPAPDWPFLLDEVCAGRLPLDVHFQPIVDLRRGTVCGYEALSRFPAFVGQPPDRWFAAAADLGMAVQLELKAIESILAHRSSVGSNCFLSLNIGPEAACAPEVQALLAGQGDLRGLVLEITEQEAVNDYRALTEALAPLRALGATVAVDDAGAGYASMRHIVALEPQFVKLDRSLIEGADADPRKSAAITAIGAFAGELDAWVIAEGIETHAELETLSSMEMPLAQGFLLGRPTREMAQLEGDLSERIRERAQRSGGGVGALMQVVASVGRDQDAAEVFGEGSVAEVAVRVDEFHRPIALLVHRAGTTEETPVMCTEPDTAPRELALRAMAREDGRRFLPAACCDARGRLLGLIPVERVVESLARS